MVRKAAAASAKTTACIARPLEFTGPPYPGALAASGVIAMDHLAGARGLAEQRQRIHQDPFLQRIVIRPPQRVAGDEAARAERARRARLRALLGLDGDEDGGDAEHLDRALHRDHGAVAQPST